ncbi:hypothetical protein GQ44DRAFT_790303, partial [Phaeosphaeriaceae sp. PMI808]
FDWRALSNTNVVDVRGGNGHVSVDLARVRYGPNYAINATLKQRTGHADEVVGRVKFQEYDFFELQPIRDAGVYLCRAIFHNHNDEDSIKMLRSLIPALEGRSDDPVLLINDIVVPERATGSVTRTEENEHRQMDI